MFHAVMECRCYEALFIDDPCIKKVSFISF